MQQNRIVRRPCRKARILCVAAIVIRPSPGALQWCSMQVTWVFPGLFVVLWSTGFIGAKLGLPYAEPFTFLGLRFLCVLALLLPLCWLTKAPWPSRRRAVQMGVSGGLIQAGYLGGVFASLHH